MNLRILNQSRIGNNASLSFKVGACHDVNQLGSDMNVREESWQEVRNSNPTGEIKSYRISSFIGESSRRFLTVKMIKHLSKKQVIKYFIFSFLIICFNSAMISCGDDEPDVSTPIIPVETPDEDDSKDKEDNDKIDPAMYDIVGKWKIDTPYYSNILEFDNNGYFSYDLNDDYYGRLTGIGTWTYDSKGKSWELKCNGSWGGAHVRINGTYTKVGNNLYYGQSIIYSPFEEVLTAVSDDNRIFGVWKGTYYGDSVEFEFKEDGHLIERWNGEYNVTMFTLKNGKITLDEELGIVLSNILNSTFSCSFSSNTKLKLYNSFDSISLTKK